MSRFSGRADLFDHMMMEKLRTKEGSDKKEDLDNTKTLYADELECFNIFKARTNGTLYQHQKVKVTELNKEKICDYCNEFKINKDNKKVSYIYYNTEYKTLKELNKHGVYITIEIKFNTILDLIPYYPYIISFCTSNDKNEIVYISNESYVDKNIKESLEIGFIFDNKFKYDSYYKKALQKHYLDVCKNYFLYKIDERTCIEDVSPPQPYDKDNYIIYLNNDVDYMHDIEFIIENPTKPFWSQPTLLKDNLVLLSNQNVEYYLADDIKNRTLKIKYVKKCNFPKILI